MAEITLQVVSGPMVGREVPVESLPVVLGRSSKSSDIAIAGDSRVSRRHCRLERDDDGQLWVVDLGSGNGTYLGDQRIENRRVIEPGATFSLGETKIRVELGDSDQMATVEADTETIVTLSERVPPSVSGEWSTRSLDPRVVQAMLAPETIEELPEERTAQLNVDPVEVERLKSRLAALQAVADALTRRSDLDELFSVVVDSILKATLAKRGVVLLPGEEGELFPVVVRSRGGVDAELTISRTIVDRAVADRMTVLIEDASTQDDLAGAKSIVFSGIRAAMCVPMMLEGRVRAVIYLDASMPKVFTDEELQLVTAIANQAAVAMDNAGLSEQLQSVCTHLKQARLKEQNLVQVFRQISRTGG